MDETGSHNRLSSKTRRRTSIRTKVFLITLAASSFVSVTSFSLTYLNDSDHAYAKIRGELVATAKTAAGSIDGDKHKVLEKGGSEKSPLYREIKEQLKGIKRANPKMRYIYTMTKTGKPNTLNFAVDAEEDPKLVSHLGDAYDISEFPEMKEAFRRACADKELTEDKWGTWLSGYAPIRDSKGRVVAIIGADMSAKEIDRILADSRKALILPLLMLIFMPPIVSLLLSSRTVRSLTEMIKAAKRIANGEYEQRIHVTTTDEIGELAEALNHMAENISERVGTAESTAIIDGLTDLYNHRYFQERLNEEVKRAGRYNRGLVLMVMDIDNFSRFNTINGHELGDLALKQMAELIRQPIGNTGMVARYSGGEFVVILPEVRLEEAALKAQAISMLISGHQFQTKHNISMPLTVSMGIAHYPTYASTSHELIDSAHEAMKKAKRKGGGGIESCKDMGGVTQAGETKAKLGYDDTLLLSAIFSLAKAVDARDQYTHKHSEFVAHYAAALGRSIGLTESDITKLSIAGLLHDIGKIGIPDAILSKPGKLSDDEWGHMKRHPVLGADIISNMEGLSNVVPIVLHHHEKYDGSGYPDGMKGEDIPHMARMLAIIDAYHAMISDRPYREGLPRDIAIAELRKHQNTQFDPELVDRFVELLETEKAKEQEPAA